MIRRELRAVPNIFRTPVAIDKGVYAMSMADGKNADIKLYGYQPVIPGVLLGHLVKKLHDGVLYTPAHLGIHLGGNLLDVEQCEVIFHHPYW